MTGFKNGTQLTMILKLMWIIVVRTVLKSSNGWSIEWENVLRNTRRTMMIGIILGLSSVFPTFNLCRECHKALAANAAMMGDFWLRST